MAMAARSCPNCGRVAEWVPQYGKHFCRGCNQYLPDAPPQYAVAAAAPVMHGQLSGTFRIVCTHSNKALDVESASTADGAKLIQWTFNGGPNQKWRVEPVGPGLYRLLASHSGKALDVEGGSTADGAKLIQWSYNGGGNQHWRIDQIAGNVYRLTCSHSGKVLDVEGGSAADGAKLIQWTYNGGGNQHWRLERA